MQIAIYSRNEAGQQVVECVSQLVQRLHSRGITAQLYEPFFRSLQQDQQRQLSSAKLFTEIQELSPAEVVCLMSVGGDGTFLDAAALAFGTSLPLVGVNAGRMGFLPIISIDNADEMLGHIASGSFDVEQRAMLQVDGCTGKRQYVLNEISLQRRGASIAEINLHINGEFLNSYWADGFIVATPTGSTAYSMSAGGPIVAPDAACLIISPIAPHSLSARPIVVPDSACIALEMMTRSGKVIVGVDSQSYELAAGCKIAVQKAAAKISFVKFKHASFYRTLREKLLWGVDVRG
ncbi:MAG: NAD(+)/NADH kinase [Prevotellaceae bacterium]|jgi:NAD+ kinase|nr:NAD(+)/NADH kinase [Prevotellaceae bacterium]